ncbi:NFASC [Mytilus edulis]|uniref:NFASC n=1 Tax=Mytilus edulis TaxID=6550 RepID=A0A8S3T6I9_MYTED|nr:NFASC [Mytilus edulis]
MCTVNLTVAKIKKYVPGEDVILYCNVNVTSNRTISWFFKNGIIWTRDKLNKMSKNSLRYEITEKMNLKIKNTSIDDEGKYTCLSVPPVINGKYTVMLKSEPSVRKTDSNNNDSLVTDGRYTANPGDVSNYQSADHLIQYDDSEYLHPYHSLVPVINTDKQDYEQINLQNKDDVCVSNDTSRRNEKIRSPIRLVSDNRILSNGDCTTDDLRRDDVRKLVCNTNSDNKIVARHVVIIQTNHIKILQM